MASNPQAYPLELAGLEPEAVTAHERATLLISVLIISVCALTYELIVATLSSYLLGDSVTQFSFTIGIFLFAMGIGALVSRRIRVDELRWFIIVELLTGLAGGLSAAFLYMVFTSLNDYYQPLMFLVTLAIGICVGLELPLLMRIVANRTDLTNALADVFSVDYLGSLIASIIFPVILLPILGVIQTAFLMGLLNIIVSAINLRLFRSRLSRRWARLLSWLASALALGMVLGAVLSTDLVRIFEQQLYEDRIIYSTQSPLQRIVVTRGGEDIRLYLNGNLQFSSRDEYRYHEMLVHPVMSLPRSREKVVILGGGDGLAAREVLKYQDVQQIILVDLDPVMTDLGRHSPLLTRLNQNALNNPRVTVVNQDAYKFIEESSDRYPIIIVDLPDPNNEALGKLYSTAFYQLLREHLTPDGALITQATSPYFVRSSFWMIAHTIEAAGFYSTPLRAYVPSFGEWGFVIGTAYRPRTLSLSEQIELQFLTPEVLQAAQVFDPDIAEVETEINTLNNPILPRLYDAEWRQWN